MLTVTIERAGY